MVSPCPAAQNFAKLDSHGPVDLVIVDTAGRLHTAYALMEELEECKAAISAKAAGQPEETLLVLDGTTGESISLCRVRGTMSLTNYCLSSIVVQGRWPRSSAQVVDSQRCCTHVNHRY